MGRKRQKPTVHGWLVLDKPVGRTSNQALGRLKRLFGCRKAGFAGTLDPLASGMLPIAFGEATKTIPYVVDDTKVYEFDVRWGAATDTDDSEGEICATSDKRPTSADIDALLPDFTGVIAQVPPRFSAVKVEGERAYALARAGEAVELAAREVEVDDLVRLNDDTEQTTFRCVCGPGTYVRALARDLGERLGCHGHVTALRRTAEGPFDVDDMVTMDAVEAAAEKGPEALKAQLLPLGAGLAGMPEVSVLRNDAALLARGQAVLLRGRDAPVVEGMVAVTCGGDVIALAEGDGARLQPRRVFDLSTA